MTWSVLPTDFSAHFPQETGSVSGNKSGEGLFVYSVAFYNGVIDKKKKVSMWKSQLQSSLPTLRCTPSLKTASASHLVRDRVVQYVRWFYVKNFLQCICFFLWCTVGPGCFSQKNLTESIRLQSHGSLWWRYFSFTRGNQWSYDVYSQFQIIDDNLNDLK